MYSNMRRTSSLYFPSKKTKNRKIFFFGGGLKKILTSNTLAQLIYVHGAVTEGGSKAHALLCVPTGVVEIENSQTMFGIWWTENEK